jgi:predicted metal-dependent hydrolase
VITPESKVHRNPQVAARELSEGEGAALLHLESGQYHGVNQIGLIIWELLEGERTVADVVDAVRARVEDPPPGLESDVVRFLESVHERDLIVVD